MGLQVFFEETMILRQLLLFLASSFLNVRKKHAGPQENFAETVQKVISKEVSNIGYKIMAGLILVAVIIFSVVQFGQAIQTWLNQYENGYVYQIIAFGTIAAICCLGLYKLFHEKEEQPELVMNPQLDVSHLTVKNISSEFMKGFFSGFRTPRTHSNMSMINGMEQKNIY